MHEVTHSLRAIPGADEAHATHVDSGWGHHFASVCGSAPTSEMRSLPMMERGCLVQPLLLYL